MLRNNKTVPKAKRRWKSDSPVGWINAFFHQDLESVTVVLVVTNGSSHMLTRSIRSFSIILLFLALFVALVFKRLLHMTGLRLDVFLCEHVMNKKIVQLLENILNRTSLNRRHKWSCFFFMIQDVKDNWLWKGLLQRSVVRLSKDKFS